MLIKFLGASTRNRISINSVSLCKFKTICLYVNYVYADPVPLLSCQSSQSYVHGHACCNQLINDERIHFITIGETVGRDSFKKKIIFKL